MRADARKKVAAALHEEPASTANPLPAALAISTSAALCLLIVLVLTLDVTSDEPVRRSAPEMTDRKTTWSPTTFTSTRSAKKIADLSNWDPLDSVASACGNSSSAQVKPSGGNCTASTGIELAIKRAAEEGAKLVILPEDYNITDGYPSGHKESFREVDLAEEYGSYSTETLLRALRTYPYPDDLMLQADGDEINILLNPDELDGDISWDQIVHTLLDIYDVYKLAWAGDSPGKWVRVIEKLSLKHPWGAVVGVPVSASRGPRTASTSRSSAISA